MLIIYFTTLYFFLSVNHAYAHGGEELILIKGAETIAYVTAFIILARNRTKKINKIYAFGLLLTGILVEIATSFVPYIFNATLINSASMISTLFATGLSVWICKLPAGNSRKQSINIKIIVIFCTVWLTSITGIFAYILLAEEERESLNAGIAQLKSGNYYAARQKIDPLAQSGNSQARSLMAEIYMNGLGVDVNTDKAKYWLSCEGILICVEGEAEYKFALLFSKEILLRSGSVFPAPVEPSPFTKYDINKAIYWMQISSAKGYRNADIWLNDNAKTEKTTP